MTETIVLVDGHAIAYRAYFALTSGGQAERWQTKEGEPTAGTFGFASILLRILEQYRPDYLAIAFDRGKTFRNEMYPDYKGTRAKMPDDLRAQMERMKELVDRLGVPRLELDGFEADDILGSTAKSVAAKGFDVKIITGDRDLLQLVDERVTVCLPGSRFTDAKDYDADMVTEYLGVPPKQIVDYKALVGDTSDNYPGVNGIGPKTAVKLLETYGNLDGIYAHLDEIKGAAKTKLQKDKESAYLSQALAQIKLDLPDIFNMEEAATSKMNFASAEQFFRELSFNTLVPKLRRLIPYYVRPEGQPTLFSVVPDISDESVDEAVLLTHYTPKSLVVVDSSEKLRALTERLRTAKRIALDTETTGVDAMSCDLVGISLSVEQGEGFYIPVGHRVLSTQLPIEEVRDALAPILADASVEKAGHNIKFDLMVLRRYGMDARGIGFDTMIAGWMLDPTSRSLGLKPMARLLLNISMTEIEELIGKGRNQITMDQVPVERAAPYAAADAEVTLRLIEPLRAKLEEEGTLDLFTKVEIPLIPVLADMEMAGIQLDSEALKTMSQSMSERLAAIEADIYRAVGYPFNLNSTQQLSTALFDTLGLPAPARTKKTASGYYSTAAGVLEEMTGLHPVIGWILEHRELSKLKSTYCDALPESIDPVTGRIHTSFNQTGTVTGRLASSSPNLQNIPTRTEMGRRIRSAFVMPEGYRLLSVDYSQIELRIVAHMAGDASMVSAFRAGQDIHAATAAAIYHCPIEEVTKDMRRHAKAINFGLIYGMSSFGLSRASDLTPAEAAVFVKTYFEQFPGVKRFLDGLRVQAANDGFVTTLWGRKRYFPDLKTETNRNLRDRAEREAINAPVQGTSADILKAAMIQLAAAFRERDLHGRILLQVHDELLMEVPEAELDETRRLVKEVMEGVIALSVPLVTEARVGADWGSLTVADDESA